MELRNIYIISRAIAFLLVSGLAGARVSAQDNKPKPPAQPESGPGGSDYRHAAVTRSRHGEGAKEFWIFQPAEPAAKSAPLIVFNHGWSAVDPIVYSAWIEHIVRHGNIVIYPRYQESILTPPKEFAPNAIEAVKAALEILKGEGRTKPELDKFAIVGHSAGGLLSANMAALAKESGLPEPKAVMCVQPGKSDMSAGNMKFVMEDLSKIPANTLLLTIAGDRDNVCGDYDAKKIIKESTSVPAANKNFILIPSDEHGSPSLLATHMEPLAISPEWNKDEKAPAPAQGRLRNRIIRGDFGPLLDFVNSERGKGLREAISRTGMLGDLFNSITAHDYYGYWRLFDALCETAFYGANRDAVLGNTPQQRAMGKWSDGTPVKELQIIEVSSDK